MAGPRGSPPATSPAPGPGTSAPGHGAAGLARPPGGAGAPRTHRAGGRALCRAAIAERAHREQLGEVRRRVVDHLKGLKVAILVENGFERVELVQPRQALDEAGADTRIVSLGTERFDPGTSPNGVRSSPSTCPSRPPSRRTSTRYCYRAA